jgi:hypothetical protein
MVAPPSFTVNVAEFTVRGFYASLNITVTEVPIGTFAALLTGLVEMTVGGVVFGVALVVKLQTYGSARELPDKSTIPVESVAVKTAFAANALDGANVAVTPE